MPNQPNDVVNISFKLTRAERAAVKELADGNVSAYLRTLARADAAKRELSWPDAALTDTRGKYPRRNE
jgi:hypothetical protein